MYDNIICVSWWLSSNYLMKDQILVKLSIHIEIGCHIFKGILIFILMKSCNCMISNFQKLFIIVVSINFKRPLRYQFHHPRSFVFFVLTIEWNIADVQEQLVFCIGYHFLQHRNKWPDINAIFCLHFLDD